MSHAKVSQCVHDGARAREEGKASTACPYGATDARYRSAWLAGWHDRDRELTGNWYFPVGE